MEMKEYISNTKGNHIFLDFKNFYGNEYKLGNFVFELMQRAINTRSTLKIVHKHLEILNKDTPPGFTSVCLLDSSHITSHSYTDDGLLAMDLFSCGDTNVVEVMDYIKDELIKEFPNIKCTYLENHRRFNF